MRRWMWAVVWLVVAPGLVAAQAANERRGQGYVFLAPVAVSDEGAVATVHVGIGGEGLVSRGLGLGGEIGYLAPPGRLEAGVGLFSANGSYHFRRGQKLVPFVTGGYSLLFRSGAAHGANFGGGINYWFRDRIGWRLEFRDQIADLDGPAHYVGFRIGLAFR
jgi:hypothetical protein